MTASLAEYPYDRYVLYIVHHAGMNRRMACLVSKEHRMTISYARYLMAVHLKRMLTKLETVDHINENKLDDRIENLQILTRSANSKKYASANPKQLFTFICPICSKEFSKDKRQSYQYLKFGKYPFCSKNCSYDNQRKVKE